MLQGRPVLAALLAGFSALAGAEPFALVDACFVRVEQAPFAPGANVAASSAESRLGIRRRAGQLFDVELSVAGPAGAVCSVSGVARLRPGDVLALPVRPDIAAAAKRSATPCLVYVRATPDAVEITTTEAACQAQSLCAGIVPLQGQRFELGSRVPSNGRQCFAGGAPGLAAPELRH